MKVVVTGASGFIGSFVTNSLKLGGYSVTELDRSKFLEVSNTWPEIFANAYAVIHCAGLAHTKLQNNQATKDMVFRANVELTAKLCEAATRSDVRKFIFLSSAKVYGEYSKFGHKFSESCELSGKSLYGETKNLAEKIISEHFAGTNTNFTILRLPLTYGNENKANFKKLEKLVHLGLPLPLLGIHNRRSILHINNLFDVISLLLRNEDRQNTVYNVCDGEAVSTTNLIRLIAKTRGRRVRLFRVNSFLMYRFFRFIGYPEIYNALWRSFELDNTLIKSELNWLPKYHLNDITGK